MKKISPYEIEAMAYNLLAFGFNIQSVEYMKNVNEQVKTLIQKVSNLLSLNLTTDEHLQMMLSAHISKNDYKITKSKILFLTLPWRK